MNGRKLSKAQHCLSVVTVTIMAAGGLLAIAGGAGASSEPANVAAAQKIVAEFTKRPTLANMGIKTPVGKHIPTGKTIAFINCGVPSCAGDAQLVTQGDSVLGWKTTDINTDGTPQQVQNAWTQILREKPNGVVTSGFPRSEFNASLLQAKADGIAVVDDSTTDPAKNGIDYVDPTLPYEAAAAKVMAAWTVANSNGAPDVLVVNVPDFPALNTIVKSFNANFPKMAPKGTVNTLTVPLADLGTTSPDVIVSYLRAHPNIKYVVPTFTDLWSGVPAALKAANLTGIRSISIVTTPDAEQYVAAGQLSAGIAWDAPVADYTMVDALARIFAGAPLVRTSYPIWVITKANLPPIETNYPVVIGAPAYFAKLWGKG